MFKVISNSHPPTKFKQTNKTQLFKFSNNHRKWYFAVKERKGKD